MKYSSFQIRNFRRFEYLVLEDLTTVNLVAGRNNVGKTSLLEALWIHQGYDLPDLGVRANALRGRVLQDFLDDFLGDLFFSYDSGKQISLEASGEWGPRPRVLEIKMQARAETSIRVESGEWEQSGGQTQATQTPRESAYQAYMKYTDENGDSREALAWLTQEALPNGTALGIRAKRMESRKRPVSVFLSSRRREVPHTIADRFSTLVKRGQDGKVLRLLQQVDDRIKNVDVLSENGRPSVHVDSGYGFKPSNLIGDGVARLIEIVSDLAYAEGGLLLVDEIENGLHWSVMPYVWEGLAEFAREFDVQVFATTHNIECIKAANEAFKRTPDGFFSLHRLEARNGEIRQVRYDTELLDIAIQQELEVR